MGVNEPLLVSALVANQVPEALVPGVVGALSEDFKYSKEVVSLLQQILENLGEPSLVTDLFLRVEEVPTLPGGLPPLFAWLQGTGVTPIQVTEVLNALVVAMESNKSWFVKVNPFA